jgi:hypothetical protein
MGFETTIPASERAKTVHALDRSATVTGLPTIIKTNLINTVICDFNDFISGTDWMRS